MKVRVIVGKELTRRYQSGNGLEVIHSSSDFGVQGDGDVIAIREDGQFRALLAGRLIGKRNQAEGLTRGDASQDDIRKLLFSQSTESCMKELEGRFILVRLDNAGTLEVTSDRFTQIDLYYQQIEDGAVFASDLDLLPFKDGTVEYDQAAVVHALYVYGFRPPKRHTLVKGVKRLGVGEIASWQDGRLNFR